MLLVRTQYHPVAVTALFLACLFLQPAEPLAESWPEKNGKPAILVAYANTYERKFEEIT
jgi:hypothetical protein